MSFTVLEVSEELLYEESVQECRSECYWYTMSCSCLHVGEGRIRKEFSKYEALLSHLVFPSEPSRAYKKHTVLWCKECVLSGQKTDSSVLIAGCLECATFRCLTHLPPHLRDEKHPFGMSLETGHIYCLKCGDFVYDRLLEGIRVDALNKFRTNLGLSMVSSWNPTDEDLKRLARSRCVEGGGTVRGLVNLGQTCFMNCILQSFLHSPSLRDFFLSHQHHCSLATPNACLVCQMQSTFQFFYNGTSRYSFVPATMLHTVWTRSHLSGYRQHDAHEFFITAIELLHRDSRTSFSNQTVSPDCKCIIDQLFTGQLQSDLRCSCCGKVSTKVDPFWDVSLNLSQGFRELSLDKCLEGYVSSEALDSAFPCASCHAGGLHKQLSFLRTPVICVFHLKRFEHDTQLRKKITTRVSFTERLDMSPYTTSYRNQPQLFDYSRGSAAHLNRRSYEYSLFAVVQHEGSLDSGHYTAFVRSFNTWYLCDDERIRPVSLDKVLSAEAYILFYHSTHLKFK